MTVKLYSATGAKQPGTVKVPEAKLSKTAVSRTVRAVLANERRERPLVKTRGNVAGGGAKPHRQKGTGRARAGTIRSPLWRGGGITFGPSGEFRARKRSPRKVRQSATQVLVGNLAAGDRLSVIAGKPSVPKTKDAAKLFAKLVPAGTALFVVGRDEYDGAVGARNLRSVELTTVDDCSAADLARYGQVVMTKAAFDALTVVSKPKPKTTPAAPKKAPAKPTARKTTSKSIAKKAAKPRSKR